MSRLCRQAEQYRAQQGSIDHDRQKGVIFKRARLTEPLTRLQPVLPFGSVLTECCWRRAQNPSDPYFGNDSLTTLCPNAINLSSERLSKVSPSSLFLLSPDWRVRLC